MNAKDTYNKAYSTRRAVKSGRITIEEHLSLWSDTKEEVILSEKAISSFVNRKREVKTWNNGLLMRKFFAAK